MKCRNVTTSKRRNQTRALIMLGAIAAASALNAAAHAVIDFKRGEPAPPLELAAMDGAAVKTAEMKGRTLVIVFAQSGQENTRRAIEHVSKCVKAPPLADVPINWLMIYSKSSDAESIERETAALAADNKGLKIVLDAAREAFGSYRVVVAPSTVVIDGEGKIVHAMAGLPPRYADILADALLLAAGKISVDKFEQTVSGPATEAPDENQQRALRMTRLGMKLLQRGMDSTAEVEFREAIELAPALAGAHLGLAEVLLNQKQYNEAQQEYRAAMEIEPDSLQALIGMAFVFAARGGEGDFEQAEQLATKAIERQKSSARAHFVLGMVHEQRGRMAEAAASYKTAAELLFKQQPIDGVDDEDPG